MPYKPPVAIYDACTLYPFHLRNLLIQCAVDRLVEVRWTDRIHDEWIRNLVASNPNVGVGRLQKTRELMNAVLPNATVLEYEEHIPSITLPDPDDRHVVAAGIATGATVIVTWNVRDFPARELAKHGLCGQQPDGFLMNLYAEIPDAAIAMTANAKRNLRKTAILGAIKAKTSPP